MRYVYGLSTALLVGGASLSLTTGYPAGAQVAQNDDTRLEQIVPRTGAPASFADLTEQLQPAVVNISTRQRIEVRGNPFAGTPFAELFGRGNPGAQPQTREAQSLGSGFIISADGYIVTNNHVVAPDNRATLEQITVTMPDGTEYRAELVGADPASDVAVLKVNRSQPFPFVKFGESGSIRAGDWVIAIGNPFGLGGTVTSGIVSAVLRNAGGGAYDRFLQTDASINRGNSGGPLFDMRGKVIGMNNAIISPTGGSVGIGFAIPSDVVSPIVKQLIAGEEIERGYLGVSIQPVNDDLADSLGLPRNRGEFVQTVQEDGAAAKAGIQAGDVVTAINGKPVTSEQTLSFLVANIAPGTNIPVDLIRNGQQRRVTVIVGKRPSEAELRQQAQVFDPNAEPEPTPEDSSSLIETKLGLQVLALTPQILRQLGADADTVGVVIGAVDPNADAAAKGLQRGDIILSANYLKVASTADLEAAVAEAENAGREAVLLQIQRRGGVTAYFPVRMRK
ncbi:MAG: protease [Erythrobacter sp. RIFCSPHIGHO2_12_FULL_63_10]|nr:MAG: protease [Erythrobacter sp. RIFCSPHIGHO2_12_FULL_63_10]